MQFDMREIIARIVDGSRFDEYQPRHGQSLECGLARLHGYQVGILTNRVLFNDTLLKGACVIQLCDKNRTPLLSSNITSFMVGREYERRGIAKIGAKLIMAVGGASVPGYRRTKRAALCPAYSWLCLYERRVDHFAAASGKSNICFVYVSTTIENGIRAFV